MNKIYKIIWSRTKNCYVVASELAKGHTKATSTGKVKEGKLSSAIGLAMVNSLIIPTILFGTAFLGGVGSVDAVGAIDTNQKGIAIKVAGTSSATTTGGYSDIAIGSGATAATAAPPASGGGNGTVAIGYTAGATGAQATAIGYEAKASGTSSEAIGQNASAEGVDAIAIGRAASTAAVQGIVLGADTKATGTGAVAVGAGSVAGTKNTDYNGVAIGGSAAGTINIENKNYDYTIKTTTGGGSFATALGVGATANGQSSLSIGSGYVAPNSENGYTAPRVTNATGYNAVAIGTGATADGTHNLAIGIGSEAQTTSDTKFDGKTLFSDGTAVKSHYATAVGPYAKSNGQYTIAVGYKASANEMAAVAIGRNTEASGFQSIAIGGGEQNMHGTTQKTIASGRGATALGTGAQSMSRGTIAIGAGYLDFDDTSKVRVAQASGQGAVSIGTSSYTSGFGNTALGLYSFAGNTDTSVKDSDGKIGDVEADAAKYKRFATAVGSYTTATETGTFAGGYRSNASAEYATAIGTKATASGKNSVSIGLSTVASKDDAVAIGSQAAASESSSVALGSLANASANSAVAIGKRAQAQSLRSIAVGVSASTTGEDSLALGSNAQASKNRAIALGAVAQATGESAISIGDTSTASNKYSVALGLLAKATNEFSVALGSHSVTADPQETRSYTVDGKTYNFAGSPFGTVSIGGPNSDGNTYYRTITNVAAGRISETSTDAINGSQLFAAMEAIESTANIAKTNVSAAQASKVAAGKNVTVTSTAATATAPLTYTVNADAAKVAGEGSVSVVSSAKDADGVTTYTVKLSDTAQTAITNSGNAANKDLSNITPAGQSTVKALANDAVKVEKAEGSGITVQADSTTKPGTTTYKVGLDADTQAQLAKASFEETVTQGSNVTVKKTDSTATKGAEYTVSLNNNLNLGNAGSVTIGDTKVEAGGLTITDGPSVTKEGGINAGNKAITNVAAGTNAGDAVNYGQLSTAQQALENKITESGNNAVNAAKAASTKVAAGNNTAVTSTADGATGAVTYTVNTDAAKVAGEGSVSVVSSAKDADGVTTYTVKLAEDAQTAINNASNAANKDLSNITPAGQSTVKALANEAVKVEKVDGSGITVDASTAAGTTTYKVGLDADTKAQLAKASLEESVEAGTNISVTKQEATETAGAEYTVALNNNLNLGNAGSVTIGDTKVAADGLTITGGPSVTKEGGINAGGKAITNVADGRNAGDAVNYGQLSTAKQELEDKITASGNNAVNAAKAASTKVAAGNHTAVTSTADGVTGAVTYTVNADAAKVAGEGSVSVVSSAKDADGVTTYTVKLAEDAQTAINNASNAANKDLSNITPAGQSTVKALANEAVKVEKVDGSGITVDASTAAGTTTYKVGLDADTKAQLAKASLEESVEAGTNISVTKQEATETAGAAYTVALNNNLDLSNAGSVTIGDTKVEAGGLTITGGPSVTKEGGINAGGKAITNVGAGTNATDAVNKGQLDEEIGKIKAVASAGKTVVVDGINTTVIAEPSEATGVTTYKVNADKTTVSTPTAAEGTTAYLTVTASASTAENRTTDYVVDLSESAKASLANADNAANKDLGNLSDAGTNKIKEVAQTAVKVEKAENSGITVEADSTSEEGTTTYKVGLDSDTKEN